MGQGGGRSGTGNGCSLIPQMSNKRLPANFAVCRGNSLIRSRHLAWVGTKRSGSRPSPPSECSARWRLRFSHPQCHRKNIAGLFDPSLNRAPVLPHESVVMNLLHASICASRSLIYSRPLRRIASFNVPRGTPPLARSLPSGLTDSRIAKPPVPRGTISDPVRPISHPLHSFLYSTPSQPPPYRSRYDTAAPANQTHQARAEAAHHELHRLARHLPNQPQQALAIQFGGRIIEQQRGLDLGVGGEQPQLGDQTRPRPGASAGPAKSDPSPALHRAEY